MDAREFLAKAREAEAIADAAKNRRERRRWEDIAKEYRRLANAVSRRPGAQPLPGPQN